MQLEHYHGQPTENLLQSKVVFKKFVVYISTNTQLITMSAIPKTINKALNLYAHLISDVGKEIALPGKPKTGWKKYSEIFCDSLILWGLHNRAELVDEQRKNTTANIREAFKDLDVSHSMVKVVNEGYIKANSYFSSEILQKHRKKFRRSAAYQAGYFSIKVTLHELEAVSLISELQPILDELEVDYIILHDIDIATDCRYVTSRPILQQYLEDKFGEDLDIADDLHKVGNHCLSWFGLTEKDQKVRCKVYNKLVQMLESAEVKMSLGSRMENFVMDVDVDLHKRLRKAKKTGLTRLELTFYGQEIYTFSYYKGVLDAIKEEIQECPTFCVKHKAYWKYIVGNISSMVGMHITMGEKSAFAYCHWWNSVTGKKYGSYRNDVEREEAMTLLANYSFNDRPIYFLEVEMDGDKISDITVTKYKRPDECTAITLVAGAHKGMYPYIYDDDVLQFEDMGIVEVDNVKIQWPERRIRKGGPPIVDIYLENMNGENFIQIHDRAIHKATYKAGYNVLEINTSYTVIAIAMDTYHNKEYIFATLSNGIKVRCGLSLERKIVAWLEEYSDVQVPYMNFTTLQCRTVRGFKDIYIR
jgi:hypothetical protein